MNKWERFQADLETALAENSKRLLREKGLFSEGDSYREQGCRYEEWWKNLQLSVGANSHCRVDEEGVSMGPNLAPEFQHPDDKGKYTVTFNHISQSQVARLMSYAKTLEERKKWTDFKNEYESTLFVEGV